MKLFLPKQPIFFNYFKELNLCIKEITAVFSDFATVFKNFDQFMAKAEEIEHKGDMITHNIIDALNKTFITPFDREDIYTFAHDMDNIIDTIEKIIKTFCIYEIKVKRSGVDEFVALAVQASQYLDELVKESFEQQKHTPNINGWIVKIHGAEDRGDLLYQKNLQQLFSEEKDPILVIKWKDILNNLEDLMDRFQLVSDTIEGIVVKAS